MCDCPAFAVRDVNAVTERDVGAGCGLLVVERVVDRVPCALGAFCASWAFRCVMGAGSASWAVGRGNGKEKVYGSIPTRGSQVVEAFSKFVLVQFVAFVDRVMETLKRSGCTGCPLVMKIGHFL
jgi:hypothetical protein